MLRSMATLGLLLSPLLAAAPDADEANSVCAVTEPTHDQPSPSFGRGPWYVNDDRTIWAAAAGMVAGPENNKVPWFRPKGTQLVASGRRLDAQAAAAHVDTPCCYGGRLQVSGITIPSEGCWEISARSGNSKLTFVTWVSAERRQH